MRVYNGVGYEVCFFGKKYFSNSCHHSALIFVFYARYLENNNYKLI